jgi:hypothetical protein
MSAALMSARVERFVRDMLRCGRHQPALSPINLVELKRQHELLIALMHGPLLRALLSHRIQAAQRAHLASWLAAHIALVAACGLEEFVTHHRTADVIAAADNAWQIGDLLGALSLVHGWHAFGVGVGKDLQADEAVGERGKAAAAPGTSGSD